MFAAVGKNFVARDDQPTRGVPALSAQIELLNESGNRQTYKVDASILTPPEQMPQLQNELHRALQKAQSSLQNGRFEITNVEAVRDAQGTTVPTEDDLAMLAAS